MRHEILQTYHDNILYGHGGISKTFERIRELYFWPSMHKSVSTYCRNCKVCLYKKDVFHSKAPLNSVKTTFPFEKMFCDVVGPMNASNGYRYIIVFICALTKWVEARPMKTTDAVEAAQALFEEVIIRHGCCTQLICDRGTNFTSALFSIKTLTTQKRQKMCETKKT